MHAWSPDGKLLSGSMQGQSCLLDTQTSTRLFDVVGLLGPWSPQGRRVLAQHGEGHTQILEWPSQVKLGQLPKHAWQWASETRLMANAPEGILWSDFPFEEVQILDTESDPWQLFHPIDNTALGIRWRESLKRNELVSWQPGLALEVAVRPDLARLQFQEWAWDPSDSSWAAMESAPEVRIQAWSHPLGHAQAQVRRETLSAGLVHAGAALLWLSPTEVRGWSRTSQEHYGLALKSKATVDCRCWHPALQRLAVAGEEALEILEVNPHV